MPIEKQHKLWVPLGTAFAREISKIFDRHWPEMLEAIRFGYLSDPRSLYRDVLMAAERYMAREYKRGQRMVRRNMVQYRRAKTLGGYSTKDASVGIGLDWGLLRAEVVPQVRRLAIALANDITESSRRRIRAAIERGVTRGQSVHQIATELRQEWMDPAKARVVAQTETSRAMHAGQGDGYKADGVAQWELLVSSDACDLCKSLAGKVVNVGEPLYVAPTGNPAYRVVRHAPIHPHCYCTMIGVV